MDWRRYLKSFLSWQSRVLLGEENWSFQFSFAPDVIISTLKQAGCRIWQREKSLTIVPPGSPLDFFFNRATYRFKGNIDWNGNATSLAGRYVLHPYLRGMMLVWFGFSYLWLVIGIFIVIANSFVNDDPTPMTQPPSM